MIDYEKLKEIHKLVSLLSKQKDIEIHLYHKIHFDGRLVTRNTFDMQSSEFSHMEWGFNNFSKKLQELIRQDSKFNIGDKVWVLNILGEPAICTQIIGKHLSDQWLVRFDDDFNAIYDEKFLFKSKNDLIEYQLQYWSKQYEELNTIDCGDKKD